METTRYKAKYQEDRVHRAESVNERFAERCRTVTE